MNALIGTFKASGILILLVVAVLAANPAAAEENNGGPSYRDRIDAAREGCKKSGGTFTMTIEVSQGRAHTKCAEKDGTSTNCTITMSSSVCENKPKESSTGPGTRRPVRDIPLVGAEITPAEGQWAAPGDALPAIEPDLIIMETDDGGDPSPEFVETEPVAAQAVGMAPMVIEDMDDEDA